MQSLSFTKRVVVLLFILIATGLFLICYYVYTSAVIKDYQDKQEVLIQRFFKGEFSNDSTKVFIVDKDYFAPRRDVSKQSINDKRLNDKEQRAEDELNRLFDIERDYMRKQYASGFALFFVVVCICIIVAGVLVRLIFRNAVRKG